MKWAVPSEEGFAWVRAYLPRLKPGLLQWRLASAYDAGRADGEKAMAAEAERRGLDDLRIARSPGDRWDHFQQQGEFR